MGGVEYEGVKWYAWQDSNLRPFAPEQSDLLAILYILSYSFHTLTSIQGLCFRSRAEPIFLQLHKVEKSFVTVFLRFKPRNRPPECELQRRRPFLLHAASIRIAVHRSHQTQAQAPGSHPAHPHPARKPQTANRLQRQAIRPVQYSITPAAHRPTRLHPSQRKVLPRYYGSSPIRSPFWSGSSHSHLGSDTRRPAA